MKRTLTALAAVAALVLPAAPASASTTPARASSPVAQHSYVQLDLVFSEGVPSSHVVVATAYAGKCRPGHCTYVEFRLVPDTADGKRWTDTEVVNAPGHYRITSVRDYTKWHVSRKLALDTSFVIR
jgi:hypothetical protein